jgi:hypothetical protein
MKLANLGYLNLARYENLAIEDVPFFFGLAFRMIEDIDLVAYTLARVRGKEMLDVDAAGEALGLIQAGAPAATDGAISFEEASPQAFVNPGMVRDVARAPLPHDDQALLLLSKYANFQLNNLLIAAARAAQLEDLEAIKTQHLLRCCQALPWPLNRSG